MGVQELREAFNAVGAPAFNCQQAFLGYTRAHDAEWQVLTFHGTDDTGASFVIVSDPIRPSGDVNAAAAATAQRLIDQRNKAS